MRFSSFPRILGVPQTEKPLLFLGKPLLFPKSKDWRVGVFSRKLCRKTHVAGADLKGGGSEDFHRERGIIAENGT